LKDLSELALEADMYVNEPARLKQRKKRINEVIPMLDEVAGPHYVGQPVRVIGVHARSEFRRESSTLVQYMSAGQVTGTSEGFTAVNYDELTSHFDKGGDERHLRLIRELQEKSVGSIGISHLIRRSIITTNSPGHLTSAHYINRAVAPVATSVIYPKEYRPAELNAEERLDELMKILHVGRSQTAEAFVRLQESVTTEQDPMKGLTECAADFKEICERGDPNTISAAHDYLNLVAGPKLFGRIYTFPEALPPSLIRTTEGKTRILQFPEENPHSFLVMDLAIAGELETKDDTIKMNDQRTLYAVAHLYENGAIDPSSIFIPIDKLKDHPFQQLGLAINNTDAVPV
jgi:hypothetical protein